MAKYCDSIVRNRLKQFILYKGLSVRAFQMQAELSNSFVASIDQSIAPKTQRKIQSAFPDLNMGWLLTGEGSMLREQPQIHAVQNNNNSPHATMYANQGAVYTTIQDLPSSKDGAAPLVPIELTRKENTDIYNEMMGKAHELAEHITKVNVFSEVDFYFSVYDDSMNPTFVRGDILALRHLESGMFIINGNPYVLDTKSHGMVIRVLKEREDHYECSVLERNDRYEAFNVPKADVYMVYNIKGMIRTSF